MPSKLLAENLQSEQWRDYVIPGHTEPYRIYNPITLFRREGGKVHAILDRIGIFHFIPFTKEVVVRWKPRDKGARDNSPAAGREYI